MAAPKVLFLPGIEGTEMFFNGGPGTESRLVWIDYQAVFAGQLAYLQLAPDGVSPGPWADGITAQSGSPLPYVYGPIQAFIESQGWDLLSPGSDWRISNITMSQRLLPMVLAWAGGVPFNVICHSMGGILARCLYLQLKNAGQANLMKRLICLGTPHFGSLEAVRAFFRLNIIYHALANAGYFIPHWPEGLGPVYLDQLIATWPALYELLPWAAAGPLFEDFPQQAAEIYTLPFYQSGNQFVDANLLLQAELMQTELLGAPYPGGQVVDICGIDNQTSYALQPPRPPTSNFGYAYTDLGDGTVPLANATYPGSTLWQINQSHSLLPLDPRVWAILAPYVS